MSKATTPAVVADATPNTFTLFVRATGDRKWGGNEIQEAADKCGFTHDHHRVVGVLVVPGEFKKRPVCCLSYRQNFSMHNKLTEITVAMDLDNDEPHFLSFKKMRDNTELLAKALDGLVYLSDGALATAEALDAEGARIALVHDLRRRAQRAQDTQVLPDGTLLEMDEFPWRQFHRQANGKLIRFERYRVAPASHYRGQAEGRRMMKLLVEAVQSRTERFNFRLDSMLGEALRGHGNLNIGSYYGVHVDNVTIGFIDALEEVLRAFALMISDSTGWDKQIAYFEKRAGEQEAEMAREKQAFVTRMRVAREQKRVARAIANAPKAPAPPAPAKIRKAVPA
ncbi:MAG: hypothetical protein V4505_25755 [Pseudomonadota bacterium]